MKPDKHITAAMILLLMSALTSASAAWSAETCTAPTLPSVQAGIHRSVGYLLDSLHRNGRFTYRRYFDPSAKPAHASYNLLRHAGAIYALGLYYGLSGDNSVREPMQRAARFLTDCCIAPLPESRAGHNDMLVVWSDQKMTGIPSYPLVAKLGGVGLGLVALMSVEKVRPHQGKGEGDSRKMAIARRLGHFIVFMQEPDGRFFSRYLPALSPSRHGHDLLYYPGEAALGLLMLYQQDPNPVWLSAAVRALTYLADSRARAAPDKVEKDNWALIASAMLLKKWPQRVSREQTKKIIRHAALIARAILSDLPREQTPVTAGALEAGGRTVPTAMNLEGVLAALRILPNGYAPLIARLQTAADCAMDFLLRSQITSGALNGGMPIFPRLEDNFQRGPAVANIRIDYVQHTLDAMIGYAAQRIETRAAPQKPLK